jgi:hypothetical protein
MKRVGRSPVTPKKLFKPLTDDDTDAVQSGEAELRSELLAAKLETQELRSQLLWAISRIEALASTSSEHAAKLIGLTEVQNALVQDNPSEFAHVTAEDIASETALFQAKYLLHHLENSPNLSSHLHSLNVVLDNIEHGRWNTDHTWPNPNIAQTLKSFRATCAKLSKTDQPLFRFSDPQFMQRLHASAMHPVERCAVNLDDMSRAAFNLILDQHGRVLQPAELEKLPIWPEAGKQIATYTANMRTCMLTWRRVFEDEEIYPSNAAWVAPPAHAWPYVRAYVDARGVVVRFIVPQPPDVVIPTVEDIHAGRVPSYEAALYPCKTEPAPSVPPLQKLSKLDPPAPVKYTMPAPSAAQLAAGPSTYAQTAKTAPPLRTATPDPSRMRAPPMATAPQGGPEVRMAARALHNMSLVDSEHDDTREHDALMLETKPESDTELDNKLRSKMLTLFPTLQHNPGPKHKLNPAITSDLLASLHTDTLPHGNTIIMQNAPIKKYNGQSNSSMGDETLWFSQVVQHAHTTNTPLLYLLDHYTIQAANTWVQVKINPNSTRGPAVVFRGYCRRIDIESANELQMAPNLDTMCNTKYII